MVFKCKIKRLGPCCRAFVNKSVLTREDFVISSWWHLGMKLQDALRLDSRLELGKGQWPRADTVKEGMDERNGK